AHIDGPGGHRITLSGRNATRVLHVSGSTTDAKIDGLTITKGLASDDTLDGPFGPVTMGGGILNDQAHLTLSDVTLSHNRAITAGLFAAGGAVANINGANLEVYHCDFTDSSVGGGAVHAGGAIPSDLGP